MMRKHRFILMACLVVFSMSAVSCIKDRIPHHAGKPTEENGFDVGFGYVGGFASDNQTLEKDWASMKEVSLITKHFSLLWN